MLNRFWALIKTTTHQQISAVIASDLVALIPFLGLGAFFLLFSFLALFFGSPIIGSDEYTYFIFGKYLDQRATVLALDPFLPNLNNVLYFSLIHFCSQIGWLDPTLVIRMLHIVEYVLAAGFLYIALLGIGERRYLILGLMGVLLLPHAAYTLVIMPEIELVLASAVLGYVFLVVFPRRTILGTLLMGFVTGFSLLIKPHAAALLGAVLLAMLGMGYFRIFPRKHTFSMAGLALITLATACGVALLAWRLTGNAWTLNPKVILGLNYYQEFLGQRPEAGHVMRKAMDFLKYAGAHTIVLFLIFSPALVGIGMSFKQLWLRKKNPLALGDGDSKLFMTVLFVAALIIAHVCMVAYFSAGVAPLGEGEAMRLHGRYLGPMIVYLPFLAFYYLRHHGEKYWQVLLPVFAAAALISQMVIFRFFKLFPWDYPVLFGYFIAPNHYQWSFHGHVQLGHWLMLSTFVGIAAAWVYRKSAALIISFLLLFVFAAGTFQTLNWMRVHSKSRQELVRYPRILAQSLEQDTLGRGVLVWPSRDDMTYILYGLANAPKVLLREPDSVINPEDITGADWVLFNRNYKTNFEHEQKTEVGAFHFILLKPGILDQDAPKNHGQPESENLITPGY